MYEKQAATYPSGRNNPPVSIDPLVDKVDAEKVQDQTAHDVVGKSTGMYQHPPRSSPHVGELTYRSCDTAGKSPLFDSVVWILNEAVPPYQHPTFQSDPYPPEIHSPVKTNCPTVAEKPDKNALNGYTHY